MSHDTETFAPDFFVVGAAKAGTTAIYNWLSVHEEVFVPMVKEPGFFAYKNRRAQPRKGPFDPKYCAQITTSERDYRSLYKTAGQRLCGDVSPVYLLDENAPAEIYTARQDARIIMVLRNPVERAFSQFMHHIRDGLEESPTFEEALKKEDQRLRDGWSWGHGYATHGHYLAQVQRFFERFPRHQILVLEFNALQVSPELCWQKICDHLGIETTPLKYNEKVNVASGLSTVPSRPGVLRSLQHPGAVQKALKKALTPQCRSFLRQRLLGAGRSAPHLCAGTREILH